VKPANFSTLLDDIRDACADVFRMCSRAAKHIATLPWPTLLVCAFVFAIAITLIPLALSVFVFFLIVKLAVTLFVVDKQRRRN
jgi:hypothetical protein